MNEPIPRPIPFERLEELRGSKRPTFRSLDEVQWLYFPKRTEQLFLRWGDPKEVGKYIADKALREGFRKLEV